MHTNATYVYVACINWFLWSLDSKLQRLIIAWGISRYYLYIVYEVRNARFCCLISDFYWQKHTHIWGSCEHCTSEKPHTVEQCTNKSSEWIIKKLPLVIIVAVWINADMGISPSIASGNQVCSYP